MEYRTESKDLEGDVANLVYEGLVDVLEGGVHAQDLVVLHDALARHRYSKQKN